MGTTPPPPVAPSRRHHYHHSYPYRSKSRHFNYLRRPVLDHTVVLTLVVVVGTLLAPCLCAPTTQTGQHWWFDSCDQQTRPTRHSRSTDYYINKLIRQLNIVNMDIKQSTKALHRLYNLSETSKAPKRDLPWIKPKQLLKKMSNCSLNDFHLAIQRFAGSLHKLSEMQVETKLSFDKKTRADIIKNTTYRIKSLLCETELTLLSNNRTVPASMPITKMNIKFDPIADVTVASTWDLLFYDKMKKFFKEAKKSLRKCNRKNKKGKKTKKGQLKKSGEKVKNTTKRTRSESN